MRRSPNRVIVKRGRVQLVRPGRRAKTLRTIGRRRR